MGFPSGPGQPDRQEDRGSGKSAESWPDASIAHGPLRLSWLPVPIDMRGLKGRNRAGEHGIVYKVVRCGLFRFSDIGIKGQGS